MKITDFPSRIELFSFISNGDFHNIGYNMWYGFIYDFWEGIKDNKEFIFFFIINNSVESKTSTTWLTSYFLTQMNLLKNKQFFSVSIDED